MIVSLIDWNMHQEIEVDDLSLDEKLGLLKIEAKTIEKKDIHDIKIQIINRASDLTQTKQSTQVKK